MSIGDRIKMRRMQMGLSVIETFEHLDDKRVKQALCGTDAQPCGSRWGGGMSRLYPIANEGAIETLRRDNAAAKGNAEKRQAEAEELERDRDERLKQSGICPKCGTWCYGDCDAGDGRSN